MKANDTAILSERKARLDVRLDPEWQEEQESPMLRGGVQRFEMSARTNAIPCGGIGLVHEFARSIGLAESSTLTCTFSSGTFLTTSPTTC